MSNSFVFSKQEEQKRRSRIRRLGSLPLLISLGIHAILLAVIFFSYSSQKPLNVKQTPRYIEAKLVKLKSTAKKTETRKKPKRVDLTKKKKPPSKSTPVKNRPSKAKPKPDNRQLEKKREAEALAKQKADNEAREQDRRRQQLLQEMEKSLEQEENLIASELSEEEALSYRAAIGQKIEQNWSRPPSARNGMTCELLIRLVPTGRVVSVTVVESSGNAAFDRSAESAVKKAEVFPELREMSSLTFEKYYRELRLVFTPQDLRQ